MKKYIMGKRGRGLIAMLIMLWAAFYACAAPAADTAAWEGLSCAGFIDDPDHRDYIDRMLKYYIASDSALQSALQEGKALVFMFEGGSDNYPAWEYSPGGSSIRNQAVTIVVKKTGNNCEIVFWCEDSSSIPSQPEDTSGGPGDRQTTIYDGIYPLRTCNHYDQYAALTVITDRGYYTPPANKDGLENYADGINIHTRTSAVAGYGDDAWSWGCQLIGTGAGAENAFNDFMKAVAGIDYDVWIDYRGGAFGKITPELDTGYYIVDRQLALTGLTGLYTQAALDNITCASRMACQAAQRMKQR